MKHKVFFTLIASMLLIISATSCIKDSKKNMDLSYNQKCVVRNKWISGRFSEHFLLISLAEDSTMLREWQTTNKIFWNRNIGDTVTFDYIRKDLFFKSNGEFQPIISTAGN